MNNIEILEEFIKHYKEVQEKYKDDEIQAEIERSCYFEEVPAEAIENLIQENKELKEAFNKMKELAETIRKENVEYIIQNRQYELHYIPKSKIKEKIEKLNKEKNEIEQAMNNKLYAYNSSYDLDIYKIEVLQELLEEGE